MSLRSNVIGCLVGVVFIKTRDDKTLFTALFYASLEGMLVVKIYVEQWFSNFFCRDVWGAVWKKTIRFVNHVF